jgi:SSS family solute:Na+ symporter
MLVVVFYGLGALVYHGIIRLLDAIQGLLGAWLSAVFLFPKVSHLGHKYKFFTFRKFSVTFTISRELVSFQPLGVGFTKSQSFGWSQISISNNRWFKFTNSANCHRESSL